MIKTILVPSDFSTQAGHALAAAHTLAILLKASITLLHVLEFPMEDAEEDETRPALVKPLPVGYLREAKREAKERLQEAALSCGIMAVPITCRVAVGNPYRHISQTLVKEAADLVVMGSKGVSGVKEVLIGSNAERLIRLAPCPVLTVKEKVNISAIRRIVWATNFPYDEMKGMQQLIYLQQALGAHLYLLRVNTAASFLNDKHVKNALQGFAESHGLKDYSIHTFNDSTEEDGIIHFADEMEADLIALATHGYRGIVHFMLGSIAEDVANHARIPIWTMRM